MKKSIPFCSFGGAKPFCSWWWKDLLWYVVGLKLPGTHTSYDEWRWDNWHWRRPGWVGDVYYYWHRARYGWSPKDTWSLDSYLNGVLSGSLEHLAEHSHGAPCGYGNPKPGDDTNFEQWDADLRRWATAFGEDPEDVEIYDRPNYVKQRAEEQRRRDAIHAALRELEPWWDALWD